MKKIFILDTNVILYDPQAIFKFPKSTIIIPIIAIEEIDTFKKEQNENGRHSRQFSRYIDTLRKKGNLSEGVKIKNGSTLRIDLNGKTQGTPLENLLHFNTADSRILSTAYHETKNHPEAVITLITKDINLRIKADIFNVKAKDYEADKVKFEEMYSGLIEIECEADLIESLSSRKEVSIKELSSLHPNQYVLLKNGDFKAVGRFDAKKESLVPLLSNNGVFGIRSKNLEQSIAFDLLLNDDIKLISLVGKAGSGKTLLAVAAGLYKSFELNIYNKLLVSRPIIPLGKDLGFLPGTIEQKLDPWTKPIMDNLDFILSGGRRNAQNNTYAAKDLLDKGRIVVEPITYIRGRSIPDQFMIVDEAQNLSPHEIKTILTRAGEGTKIVLTGDCEQIDNPYLDASSNGLSYTVERMKDQEIAGHVTLIKGERSELAELASNIL